MISRQFFFVFIQTRFSSVRACACASTCACGCTSACRNRTICFCSLGTRKTSIPTIKENEMGKRASVCELSSFSHSLAHTHAHSHSHSHSLAHSLSLHHLHFSLLGSSVSFPYFGPVSCKVAIQKFAVD